MKIIPKEKILDYRYTEKQTGWELPIHQVLLKPTSSQLVLKRIFYLLSCQGQVIWL